MSTQEIFIGKRNSEEWYGEAAELWMNIFEHSVDKPGGGFRSVIGPNGIGKTFLVKKMVEEFKKTKDSNVHVLYQAVDSVENPTVSFWVFWMGVILQIKDVINLELIEGDELVKKDLNAAFQFFEDEEKMEKVMKNNPILRPRAIKSIDTLFVSLAKLNIRIILIVDEFDLAKDTYDGAFFQKLYSISGKGLHDDYKLSVLLISRRHVSTIAHGMQKGSTLESAYPEIKINGFTDQELEVYFDLYPEGGISEEDKKTIKFFCGRSPEMLMIIYEYYHSLHRLPTPYEMRCKLDDLSYERLCNLLKTEYVDTQKEKPCMGAFLQAFVGPAYEETLEHQIDKLYNAGYILKTEAGYESIMKEFDSNWNFEFEPIAPYFLEFVKKYKKNEYLNELGIKVVQLELQIREIIRDAIKKENGENWKNYIGIPKKDGSFMSLSHLAEENHAEERDIEFSKVDVLSFLEYLFLIKKFWEPELKKYFPAYKNREALNKDFELMKIIRDCYAHRTVKVLTRENIAKAAEACDKLLKGIEDVKREMGEYTILE